MPARPRQKKPKCPWKPPLRKIKVPGGYKLVDAKGERVVYFVMASEVGALLSGFNAAYPVKPKTVNKCRRKTK